MEKSGRITIVFVGGGHAHLYALKRSNLFVREGARIVLIGPDRYHYYSGMGPGMLSRIYEPKQVRFDIQKMVENRGGTFIKGTVVFIEPSSKTLILNSGEKVSYDFVSFNIGSYIPLDLIKGAEKEAYPVKPIEKLELVREDIINRIKDGEPNIVVIGAGPAGVELSGNIWRLLRNQKGTAQIILASSREKILPGLPERVSSLATDSLKRRGIRIIPNFRAVSLENGIARSEGGIEVPYDIVVLTTGIKPKHVFAESGIATAHDGSLLVNDYLQSTSYPEIFGGGDCITLRDKQINRVGVYAVREGPILFHNLMASMTANPLKEFTPQKSYMLIFNMGNGSGIVIYRSFIWMARWAFVLKDYIDRRFMSMYQVSGEKD